MIIEFNTKYSTKNGLYSRLFIKEHDYELPIFPFSNNIDYNLETTSRDDLYNVDFLGSSNVLLDFRGDTIKETIVYIGEIYYYTK